MDKKTIVLKELGSMNDGKDPLYLAYHQDHTQSIWRSCSPCPHGGGRDCPLGSCCGFPREYHYSESDVLEKYGELKRQIEKKREYINNEKSQRKRLNEGLLRLPVEKFLLQHKISLKRELCLSRCSRSECGKAHFIMELFRQFDHFILKEFYSYHFTQSQPLLKKEKKNTTDTTLEFFCHYCNKGQFQPSAKLLLVDVNGNLILPRVTRICIYCGAETHFLVYR